MVQHFFRENMNKQGDRLKKQTFRRSSMNEDSVRLIQQVDDIQSSKRKIVFSVSNNTNNQNDNFKSIQAKSNTISPINMRTKFKDQHMQADQTLTQISGGILNQTIQSITYNNTPHPNLIIDVDIKRTQSGLKSREEVSQQVVGNQIPLKLKSNLTEMKLTHQDSSNQRSKVNIACRLNSEQNLFFKNPQLKSPRFSQSRIPIKDLKFQLDQDDENDDMNNLDSNKITPNFVLKKTFSFVQNQIPIIEPEIKAKPKKIKVIEQKFKPKKQSNLPSIHLQGKNCFNSENKALSTTINFVKPINIQKESDTQPKTSRQNDEEIIQRQYKTTQSMITQTLPIEYEKQSYPPDLYYDTNTNSNRKVFDSRQFQVNIATTANKERAQNYSNEITQKPLLPRSLFLQTFNDNSQTQKSDRRLVYQTKKRKINADLFESMQKLQGWENDASMQKLDSSQQKIQNPQDIKRKTVSSCIGITIKGKQHFSNASTYCNFQQ